MGHRLKVKLLTQEHYYLSYTALKYSTINTIRAVIIILNKCSESLGLSRLSCLYQSNQPMLTHAMA